MAKPRRRQWHPTPVRLPGKSLDGGAWWAAVHGVTKNRTRLSGFTFTFHFHALQEEMATHSSVLAWRIPGMGEPGGVAQSRTRLKRLSSSSIFASQTSWERGFPGDSDGKASACNVGDLGLIPGSGRSPGEGKDNPLQ